MKKIYIAIIIIILLSFIVAGWAYQKMPDKVASHWNSKGEVDGYMGKFWGVFLMPIVLVGLFLLLVFIPKLDPLKANVEKFRKHFDGFILIITVFMFYVFVLTILWNIGVRFNLGQFMTPAMGLLFFYIGVLLEKAKRNWFIGIRTPWTLSSDNVWDKTHQRGGKLFKIAGIIAIIGMFFPNYGMWLVLIPVFAVVIYTLVYSYVVYKEEKNQGK